MNKDIHKTETWRITDMASHMPEEFVNCVEPQGDDTVSPSPDRIKRLALEKRREYLNGNEDKPMKKLSFKILLIAAIVGIMSLTAFAAFGGLDYMKSIFGNSAETLQDAIVTPYATASADGREISLAAMVTDGYVTNLIVSVTGDMPSHTKDLFTISSNRDMRSTGWSVLEEFTTSAKTRFLVDLVSEQRFDTADITLSLNKEIAPIDLSFQIENKLGNAVIDFPEGAMSEQTQLKELQVSPMGFMLIGRESHAKGGLPATSIKLVYSDGKTENLEVEFAPSDETVMGGGGAILGGPETPLVTSFHGTRNPDGELVISDQFSRILNPDAIQKVIVEGTEYLVK